jgi:hypothetical protein
MVGTYLLAPNTTTHPDAFPRIGTIIANPKKPLKTLLSPQHVPVTLTNTANLDLTTTADLSLGASVWTDFFQVARARLATTHNTTSQSAFTAPVLSTVYMKQYPSDEDAVVIAENPIVQAAMHAGIRGRDPVYMLTGLKITKGLALEVEHSSSRSAEAGVSAPLTEEVSAGADTGVAKTTSYRQAAQTSEDDSNDVVFAYQLHIIAPKGWLRWRKYSIDMYQPKAALLHSQQNVEDQQVETRLVSLEDLEAFAEDNEDQPPHVEQLPEGDTVTNLVSFM